MSVQWPEWSILNPNKRYTPSHETDIAERFRKVREQQERERRDRERRELHEREHD